MLLLEAGGESRRTLRIIQSTRPFTRLSQRDQDLTAMELLRPRHYAAAIVKTTIPSETNKAENLASTRAGTLRRRLHGSQCLVITCCLPRTESGFGDHIIPR